MKLSLSLLNVSSMTQAFAQLPVLSIMRYQPCCVLVYALSAKCIWCKASNYLAKAAGIISG